MKWLYSDGGCNDEPSNRQNKELDAVGVVYDKRWASAYFYDGKAASTQWYPPAINFTQEIKVHEHHLIESDLLECLQIM